MLTTLLWWPLAFLRDPEAWRQRCLCGWALQWAPQGKSHTEQEVCPSQSGL